MVYIHQVQKSWMNVQFFSRYLFFPCKYILQTIYLIEEITERKKIGNRIKRAFPFFPWTSLPDEEFRKYLRLTQRSLKKFTHILYMMYGNKILSIAPQFQPVNNLPFA